MASRRGNGSVGTAPAEQPVTEQASAVAEQSAAAVDTADAEPADAEAARLADLEASDTTTNYTRRAGGYVLTDRGWVLI